MNGEIRTRNWLLGLFWVGGQKKSKYLKEKNEKSESLCQSQIHSLFFISPPAPPRFFHRIKNFPSLYLVRLSHLIIAGSMGREKSDCEISIKLMRREMLTLTE